ncbi:MAG: hypothetical protein ABSF90_26635 [Syntrophobacteraceae bacterium]|jgi:hypothetical protein
MELRPIDRTQERRILTAFICSTDYIRQVNEWLKESYLEAPGARTILKWCRDYFQKYSEAPSAHMMDRYIAAVRDNELDDDNKEYIEKLLTSLSGEWERKKEFNVQFYVDETEKFCHRKHLEQDIATMQAYMEQGRLKEADSVMRGYAPVAKKMKQNPNVFEDDDLWMRVFDYEKPRSVFELPGAWGKMMNRQFYRGSLIGLLATAKRGKSFLLMEIAMRASRYGAKVAVFEAGDMTREQRTGRIGKYVAKRPFESDKGANEIIKVSYPTDFEGTFEPREFKNLDLAGALKAKNDWQRRFGKHAPLFTDYYSTRTLTFSEIERKLAEWKEDYDFVPDVLAIDYIDIMASENTRLEHRLQEAAKWEQARRLSQELNCCLITVTQSDAAGFDNEKKLTPKNFSETVTKNQHVTAMYALNQSDDEKKRNILRISPLLIRDGSEPPDVLLLQCLEIGRPYIDSKSDSKSTEIEYDDESDKPHKKPKKGRQTKATPNPEMFD